MKTSMKVLIPVVLVSVCFSSAAQINAPGANSRVPSPSGNALPNGAFQGNFTLTPPNTAVQTPGFNSNGAIPQLVPGQGIPPMNQTVVPPVNQPVLPPVGTQPALPPSGIQPVLPPPNIQ